MANRLFLWLALVFAWISPAGAQNIAFPPLSGRVVDAAHILSADQTAGLDTKLRAIEAGTGRQLVIATIADLQGREIADYGYQLGRKWGIGAKGKNDGAIIIVAPNEHKTRIEVGYGLEPIITDAYSSVIITTRMLPSFRKGDYAGGLNQSMDALGELLKLPPEEAAARAKATVAAQQAHSARRGGSGTGFLLPFLFFGIFVFMPMFMRRRGDARGYGGDLASGLGQVALWSALNSGGFRGGGGSFGGGDDSFSGGGGSFGGGGSSGSW